MFGSLLYYALVPGSYYFHTNPVGAPVDGRITENRFPNREWDGIWNVRTSID